MKKKKIIIAITGKSGSGKTTLCNHVYSKLGIRQIESLTDRAKRTPDEVGHTFMSKEDFDKITREEMIAFTDGFGTSRYCCRHRDVVDDVMSYVLSEDGLENINKNHSELYDVVSVRIKRDIESRLSDVGAERVGRDKDNFYLDDSYFDIVISEYENTSLEVLFGSFLHKCNNKFTYFYGFEE